MRLAPPNPQLLSLLASLAGEPVTFFVNGGNAGDAVIAAATFQVLSDLGVAFEPIWHGADVAGRVLLVGGGGNLVPAYGSIRQALIEYGHRARTVIVLPHTIRGHEDVLAGLGDHVHIFCRDIESFEHASRTAGTPHVHLGHDMAFHLDPQRLLAGARPSWAERFEELSRGLALTGDAVFPRRDGERKARLPDGPDISLKFNGGVWPGEAELATYCLIRAINQADTVTTDRLHIAILAGLLGKPVTLHDNSYGKNRAVYLHSISRFLPTVTFVAAGA